MPPVERVHRLPRIGPVLELDERDPRVRNAAPRIARHNVHAHEPPEVLEHGLEGVSTDTVPDALDAERRVGQVHSVPRLGALGGRAAPPRWPPSLEEDGRAEGGGSGEDGSPANIGGAGRGGARRAGAAAARRASEHRAARGGAQE